MTNGVPVGYCGSSFLGLARDLPREPSHPVQALDRGDAMRFLTASIGTVMFVLTPCIGVSSQEAGGGGSLDFEKAARLFLSARGTEAATPDAVTLEQVIEDHFLWIQLGLFDVRFPTTGMAEHSAQLKECAAALVQAQLKLLDWLQPLRSEQKALRTDLGAIGQWIKSWKEGDLKKVAGRPAPDFPSALAATDAVKAALERSSEAMTRGVALGFSRETTEDVRLYLMPTRKDFVEFVALTGWIRTEQQGSFWAEGALDWAMCFLDQGQIIALEYAVARRPAGDYSLGTPMNERGPTCMQEQVVQLALNSLFDTYSAGRAPPAFVQGLAMNLVIDVFGQIDTRVDGDVRSRVTEKREEFVPGGDPDGGGLPKISADSRWRDTKGADHFLRAMRVAQKDGKDLAKEGENEAAVFGLRSDDGMHVQAVHAPFLGASASGANEIPDEFSGDLAELVRSYKSAFIFWLQTEGGKSAKTSKERFAQLFQKLADSAQETTFETAFPEIYDGAPLSDTSASPASLEGRFLVWIQKQK